MSIPVAHTLNLLSAQPAARQKSDFPPIPREGGFAERLEQAISAEPSAPLAGGSPKELAESLTLQMMQASLALAGDNPADASTALGSRQPYSSSQALLQAYQANLAANNRLIATELPSPLTAKPESIPAAAPLKNPPQSGTAWLEPLIEQASRRYGVDAGLIKAVIKTESDFNPQAVSAAGARGLMQLMPATARGLGVNNAFDPEQNIMAGTRFLRDLLQRYHGDLESALAAYNWGPANVDRRPDQLPRETRDYLARVKQLYASYTG